MVKLPDYYGRWIRVKNQKKLPYGLIVPEETPGFRAYYQTNPQNNKVRLVHIDERRKEGKFNLVLSEGSGVWTSVEVIWFGIKSFEEAKKMLLWWMKEHQ